MLRVAKCLMVLGLGFALTFSAVALCPTVGGAGGEALREIVWPKYYPERFDGVGRIERIGRGEIVINDTLYGLSPGATYATTEKRHAGISKLRIGERVGFVVGGEKEIISLWALE